MTNLRKLRRGVKVAIYLVLTAIMVGVVAGAAAGLLNSDTVAAVGVAVTVLTAFLTFAQQQPAPVAPALRAAELATGLASHRRTELTGQLAERGLDQDNLISVQWRVAAGTKIAVDAAKAVPSTGTVEQLCKIVADQAARGRLIRLAITGEVGAGKTAAALLLMAALSDGGSRLPVLFQLAGWQPDNPLEPWLAEQLGQLLPVIGGDTSGATQYDAAVAAALVHSHVLPVLDGLDETIDPRDALRQIDEELVGRPFVLTCNAAVFAMANRDYVLHQSLIIELQPLVPDEVAAVLTDYGPGGPLADLARAVLDDPGGPVAIALSTPFMTSLARVSPTPVANLVHAAAGPAPVDTIKQELFGAFVAKAYPRKRRDGAVRNLRFLARHADAAGRIAWWQLHQAVPRAQFVINAILIAGVIGSAMVAGFFALFSRAWLGFWIGLIIGVVGACVVEVVPQDDPRRAFPRLRMVRTPTRREFARVLGFGATGAAVVAVIGSFLYDSVSDVVSGSLIGGLMFAAARYLGQPNDPLQTVTPERMLRADRMAVLVSGLTGAVTGALTGAYLGYAFRQDHQSGYRKLAILQHPWAVSLLGAASGCVLTAVGIGLMAMGSSSWARFIWTRVWLAASGKLPLRLMGFLSDAHEREVLRQVSGYYQFRHRALQRYLAGS